MPTEWYLSTPKYFSGGESEIMGYAQDGFLELLEVSPESYLIEVNGIEHKVIVHQNGADDDSKKVLSVIGTIGIGDIIKHKGKYWLVDTFVDDNRMNDVCIMSLCNTTMKILGEPVKTKVGEEPITGKPIYSLIPSAEFLSKCVITNKIKDASSEDDAVNLPKGTFLLSIPYTINPLLKEGKNAILFGKDHKILDVDLSKTYESESGQTKGIIKVLIQRIQG